MPNGDDGDDRCCRPCECHAGDELLALTAAATTLVEASELHAEALQLIRTRLVALELSTGAGSTWCECKDLESKFQVAREILWWTVGLSLLFVLAILALPWWRAEGAVGWRFVSLLASSVGAGVLGSAIAALVSMLDRHAQGFELAGGDKVPAAGTKDDRFSARMAPWFTSRPLLGAFAGLVVFTGRSLFTPVETAREASRVAGSVSLDDALPMAEHARTVAVIDDALFTTFLALLAGLFAKTLVERLKVIFKTIIGG